MAKTQTDAPRSGESQIPRTAGAAAALLLAAAALTAAASVPGGDVDHPGNGDVLPGKVSVLGEAKVRRWTGQTFSLEVPLEWANPLKDAKNQVYGWALMRPGRKVDTTSLAKQASSDDWANAQELVAARIKVELKPAAGNPSSHSRVYSFGRRDPRYTDGFIDRGSVNFQQPSGAPGGRFAWRVDFAVPGLDSAGSKTATTESHYFFTTCKGGRHEVWHVTLNRSELSGQEAAKQKALFDTMMGSFDTLYDPSPKGSKDCGSVTATT